MNVRQLNRVVDDLEAMLEGRAVAIAACIALVCFLYMEFI